MQFILAQNESGDQALTVFVPGNPPLPFNDQHPNWEAIIEAVGADDVDLLLKLANPAEVIAEKFERLSERVSVAHGRLYFDGEEVNSVLADHVLRFMKDGLPFKPLVNFFENVSQNPNEHSREQLYAWLNANGGFAITPEGMIVGYKGVQLDGEGNYQSCQTGKAMVDGVVHTGHIPNPIGSIVEMPRSEVAWDPSNGCSTGLHVGTYSFARGFTRGPVLELHVNPRDVVSVPTDSNAQKMRVCRYTVIGVVDAAYDTALVGEAEADPTDSDEWFGADVAWGENDEEYCLDCDDEGCATCVPYDDYNEPDSGSAAVVQVNGVKIGDKFLDLDRRTDNRVLKVTGFDGQKAICEVGFIDNHFKAWFGQGRFAKIKTERLNKNWKFTRLV